MKIGKQDMRYLYEAICTASDQHLAVWREDSTFWMALFAKFYGTVQLAGVALHLIAGPLSCAPEKIKSCAWWQQALMLLPARTAAVSSLQALLNVL